MGLIDGGWPQGRLIRLSHQSRVLADNPWKDPVDRELSVYLPHGDADDGYPVLWNLAAYTNSGASMGNWRNFGENLVQRLDRLIGSGLMGPVVVVSPDCFSFLGGNQYVNSSSVGRYEDYIHDELIPFTESRLPIRPGPRHRAVFGKSSGGFGALHFGISRSDHWAAVASHSGDAQFDVIFRRDFPLAAATLARFDGQVDAFLDYFHHAENVSGSEVHTLMLICMAASYDPDPLAPDIIHLPFNLKTLELDEARWLRWQAHDPVYRIKDSVQALKSLQAVYMDCGYRDQYHIQYGNRIVSREMSAFGIDHHYEEFDGTHSGIDYRLDQSLPFLYRAITQESFTQ